MNAPDKTMARDKAAGHQSPPRGRLPLAWVVKELVHDRLMDKVVAERVLSVRSRDTQIHPLALLAEMNLRSPDAARELLDIERLTQWLAEKSGLPYQHIDPLRVDFARVVDVFSSSYATSHAILPLAISGSEVVVATCEPFADDWIPEIERLTRKGIKRVIANPLDVARFTVEFYKLAQSIKSANKNAGATTSLVSNFESLVELGGKVDAENAHIVTIVDWLLQYAFDQRASDIHLEPKREQGVVRFRIDGVLHQVYQVPPGVLNAMISRIKLLGRMDVVEKRRPLDGRIKTKVSSGLMAGREVEVRLSTLPTAFGEKLVARIFDPEVVVRGYGELGFSEAEGQSWKQLITKPSGIVLVTGPTGSGKTTTLYSTLKELATDEVNVSTVEDPIENVDPSLNQMQVNPAIDLGFADGLRALMRQDPDVIMVGEIRDRLTADMAVNAALTGHLVFSTLHTNDAASSIARLTELGVPPYLVNATLSGVLAQRLVRILCPHCKQPTDPPPEALWAELMAPWRSPLPKRVFKPVGCLECRRTGYLGRTGLIELLVMTDAMRNLIASGADLAQLRNQAARDGLRSLRVSGAEKIANGVTTLDEVLRAAPPYLH
ncbi:MAG: Flp pilus assembly complex ATPase component TadA [Burkholderiales bacterium]|jgi:general secretion pathway protein E|nr:Flp pilus assembly complex ATPase component TadA [Burkholderiales bacterium]MCA3226616.1 Flp pilus assembly complex ATPase component TadA [Burkholderiales bacterium]MCE2643830.1 Flp pilus assembly complex ATPase component TadA [Burkholderiaceae bacterium]